MKQALRLALILTIAFAVGCQVTGPQPAAPADYEPLARIDLSTQRYEEQMIGEFTLQEAALTGVHYALRDVETPYFDLRLATPGGDSLTIMQGDNLRTDQRGAGLWQQNLAPGSYQLMLTAEQGSGFVALSWGQS